MKFRVLIQKTTMSSGAHSPIRVIEQDSGREVGWINRYLDREHVRRLALTSLRIYAFNLLHFLRWWASVHHSDEIAQADAVAATPAEVLALVSSETPQGGANDAARAVTA